MVRPRRHTGASLKGRPSTEPTDAPICSAPDSMPTDAPPSTLRHVPARMPGATPPEMRSLARNWSMTLSVARFTGRRSSLYSPMDASPKAGSANKSQGKRAERPPAKVTDRVSTMDAAAPAAPTTRANATWRASCTRSTRPSCGLCACSLSCAATPPPPCRPTVSAPWYAHGTRQEGRNQTRYRAAAKRSAFARRKRAQVSTAQSTTGIAGANGKPANAAENLP